jgi:4-hydroxybenzoate polyprenyltransferase
VTRRSAITFSAVLLAGSLACAAVASQRTFAIALVLCTMIVVYDALAKGTRAGPFAMASCRALNATLGLSLGIPSPDALVPLGILFGYVLILTLVSRFEVARAPSRLIQAAAIGLVLTLGVAMGDVFLRGFSAEAPEFPVGPLLLLVLVLWLLPPYRAALRDPRPPHIIEVVKASVFGIVILDGAFVGAAIGPALGFLVALVLCLPVLLARRFASA